MPPTPPHLFCFLRRKTARDHACGGHQRTSLRPTHLPRSTKVASTGTVEVASPSSLCFILGVQHLALHSVVGVAHPRPSSLQGPVCVPVSAQGCVGLVSRCLPPEKASLPSLFISAAVLPNSNAQRIVGVSPAFVE